MLISFVFNLGEIYHNVVSERKKEKNLKYCFLSVINKNSTNPDVHVFNALDERNIKLIFLSGRIPPPCVQLLELPVEP